MVLIGELLQKRKQEASQSNDAVSLGVDKKPDTDDVSKPGIQ
jgi:hypothetical protein